MKSRRVFRSIFPASSPHLLGIVFLIGLETANAQTWSTAGGNLSSTVKVGIGTTSPSSLLQVNGTMLSRGYGAPASGLGVEIDYGGIANTGRIMAYDRGTSTYLPFSVGNGFDIAANGDITGKRNASITGTLITRGANAPSSGIGVEIDYGTSASLGRIFAYDRGTNNYLKMQLGKDFVVSANGDVSGVGAATFAGKVGVGNTSPDANLNVGPSNGSGIKVKVGGLHAGGGGLTFWNGVSSTTSTSGANDAVGGFLIYTDQDGVNGSNVHSLDIGARDYADKWNGGSQLRFMTSPLAPQSSTQPDFQAAVTRMVIDRNGNVGIGTGSPGVILDVAGRSKITGRTAGQEALIVDQAPSSATPASEIIADFRYLGVSKVQVKTNGDITTSGSIAVGSVTTKVWSIAPDYVFEKDYQLASLERVEKYLDQHKHLPDIPSAKEFKEKGLDLAEMNMKLLRKVEELTLYSIKQQKEITGLKDRLDRFDSARKNVR